MKLPRHSPDRDEDETGERYYQTPIGRLPSVTTILRATEYKPDLDRWRREMGSAAALISARGRARGAAFHKEMEEYFNADRRPIEGSEFFDSVGPFLSHVGDVALVEGAVWHGSGYAGCVDCVALVDGVLSVIDWKTAARPRRAEWVEDEHLQVAAYRAAAQELYGVDIRRGFVVVALVDDDAQVFETENLDLQWEDFLRRFSAYQAQKGSASEVSVCRDF